MKKIDIPFYEMKPYLIIIFIIGIMNYVELSETIILLVGVLGFFATYIIYLRKQSREKSPEDKSSQDNLEKNK